MTHIETNASTVEGPPESLSGTIVTDPRRRTALILIGVLVLAYLVQTVLAARGKSSTFDEPIHALSSQLIVSRGDFRVNPEHPALWKYLPGLASIGIGVEADLNTDAARRLLSRTEAQWPWGVNILYGRRGQTDLGERLVARQRTIMVVFALGTILITARWAWQAAGPTAACIATLLITLDPNFIGHGTLVTNDVAATFCFVLAGYLTWRIGLEFRWPTVAALVVCGALAIDIKFTCVLLAPMMMIPLFIRTFLNRTWPTASGAVDTRGNRLLLVSSIGLMTVGLGIALLWPAYQFRWAPTPDGHAFDPSITQHALAHDSILLQARAHGRTLSEAEVASRLPGFEAGLATRAVEWLGDRHIVPQGWSYGLLFAQAHSLGRPSFLLGTFSEGGSLWYFPVTILCKAPTGTLLIVSAALFTSLYALARRSKLSDDSVWLAICLVVPAAIYFGVAMNSNLNIGMRHVFPVGPPLFVGTAAVLAPHFLRSRRIRHSLVLGVIAIAGETAWAFPNDLSFFNTPSNLLPGGKLALLGDSNLDWGQDLPEFARFAKTWQQSNPGRPLYLCYFGSADPHAYGINYINVLTGYPFDRVKPLRQLPLDGGALAISASALQGNFSPDLSPLLKRLRNTEPYAILNDTIYVYLLPASSP